MKPPRAAARAARTPAPTPLEESACRFVAALAQDVDRRRGIETENGTPATQRRVIDVVLHECLGKTGHD